MWPPNRPLILKQNISIKFQDYCGLEAGEAKLRGKFLYKMKQWDFSVLGKRRGSSGVTKFEQEPLEKYHHKNIIATIYSSYNATFRAF